MINPGQVLEEINHAIACMRDEDLQDEDINLKCWENHGTSYGVVASTVIKVGHPEEQCRFLIQVIALERDEQP